MSVPRGLDHASDAMPEGGLPALWDVLFDVSVMIRNSGTRNGAEVAQLYIGIPNGPLKQLRGFEKRLLVAGETRKFSFELTRRDLSTWEDDGWVLQRGSYHVYVGKSVLDIQLSGVLTI
jgi:beta-glucosidase